MKRKSDLLTFPLSENINGVDRTSSTLMRHSFLRGDHRMLPSYRAPVRRGREDYDRGYESFPYEKNPTPYPTVMSDSSFGLLMITFGSVLLLCKMISMVSIACRRNRNNVTTVYPTETTPLVYNLNRVTLQNNYSNSIA